MAIAEFNNCLTQYVDGLTVQLPGKGHVLTPWVTLEIENSNSKITVGNSSSPATSPKNSAVIKSMDFGHSNGMTAKIVIHDQSGSEFVTFMGSILKDVKCSVNSSVKLALQFGWVRGHCDVPFTGSYSPKYYMYIDSIEVNFSQGKFQYEITGKDLLVKSLEVADDDTKGGDGEEISLKKAIIELLTDKERPPSVTSVKFLKKDDARSSSPVGFKEGEYGDDGTREGLKSKWPSSGQSKLEVCKSWTDQHLTQNGKSWKMIYNPEVEGGEIIFWEDPGTKCNQPIEWDRHKIGSYIVNGGKFSPVIDFNPNIRWDTSRLHLAGGELNPQGPDAKGGASDGIPDCKGLSRSGGPPKSQTSTKPLDAANGDFLGQDAIEQVSENQAVNSQSLNLYPDAINADLVIIGNPEIATPALAPFSMNVSIAFVNPFHITGANNGIDWMASPPCNTILSNHGWIVTSVRHNIEAGNYRTTLGLKLFVPGIHIGKDGNLGGDVKGWKPTFNCPVET